MKPRWQRPTLVVLVLALPLAHIRGAQAAEPPVAADPAPARGGAVAVARDHELAPLYARIAEDLRAGGALRVTVYVALCDNEAQGIVPVKNRKLCDGDAPEQNLYWRTRGGLASYLRAERYRELEYTRDDRDRIAVRARYAKTFPAGAALRARGITSVPVELTALAYRGAQIAAAMFDFVRAVQHGPVDARSAPHVVGYIGHNYLLDPHDGSELQRARATRSRLELGVFALSCFGEQLLRPVITRPGAHVLVLNRNLTYPGAWTIGGLLTGLAQGGSHAAIHRLAAQRFAEGQNKPLGAILRAFTAGPN